MTALRDSTEVSPSLHPVDEARDDPRVDEVDEEQADQGNYEECPGRRAEARHQSTQSREGLIYSPFIMCYG